MTKQEILNDMLVKYDAYVSDYQNNDKWKAYKAAWIEWRNVRGDQ